jgi:hypothetical protein
MGEGLATGPPHLRMLCDQGVVPMGFRVRRFSTLTAALGGAVILVPAGTARPRAVLPTLYVAYTMNCTFSISDDTGKRVSAIAPGTYQVFVTTPTVFADVDLSGVFDMTACKSFVQFQLTGPGVALSTTLQDGDEDKEILKATFQPSATYTAQDLNQAGVTRTTFTTQASGTAAAPSGPTSSVSGKGSSQESLVGSAANPFRGSLDAIVYKSGKLSLSRNGKPVTALKEGRYTFSVDDESKTSGFTVKSLRGKAVGVTSAAFVGSHDVTLTLTQGRWFFYWGAGKKATFFVAS